jgi:hypothetical protein
LKKICITICLILFSFIFQLPQAHAATVTTVKNKKLIINLEGDEVAVDDEFYLLTTDTYKKVAIIRISQIKNNKALADVVSGTAKVGLTLQAKSASSNKDSSSAFTENSKIKEEKKSAGFNESSGSTINFGSNYLRILKDSYGFMGSYLSNSMSAVVSDALDAKDTVTMKGSNFGFGGYYDYLATNDITLEGAAFLEQFNTTGTSLVTGCNKKTSKNCDININYLSMYGSVKYYLTKNKYRVWFAGGGGFLVAVSKSATIFSESAISSNPVAVLSVGADIQVSRKNYVPIVLEYHYFPASGTVTASNTLALKAGWAWNAR